MQIKDLAGKPTLVPITLSDKAIIEKYGEEIVFYIYDRQPIHVYARLATLAGENKPENLEQIVEIVNEMIHDQDGNKVSDGDNSLPLDVLMHAMTAVSDYLGK